MPDTDQPNEIEVVDIPRSEITKRLSQDRPNRVNFCCSEPKFSDDGLLQARGHKCPDLDPSTPQPKGDDDFVRDANGAVVLRPYCDWYGEFLRVKPHKAGSDSEGLPIRCDECKALEGR